MGHEHPEVDMPDGGLGYPDRLVDSGSFEQDYGVPFSTVTQGQRTDLDVLHADAETSMLIDSS